MPDFLAQAPDRIPTLAGIKYTNADLMSYQLCLRAGNGRFDVPYGTDEWLLAALALGAGRGRQQLQLRRPDLSAAHQGLPGG